MSYKIGDIVDLKSNIGLILGEKDENRFYVLMYDSHVSVFDSSAHEDYSTVIVDKKYILGKILSEDKNVKLNLMNSEVFLRRRKNLNNLWESMKTQENYSDRMKSACDSIGDSCLVYKG